MPENFNDDIERLSKLAADQFQTEVKAPSWNSIEQMLNKEMPQRNNKSKYLFYFFMLTGLLAGGAFLFIQKVNFIQPKSLVVVASQAQLQTKTGKNNSQVEEKDIFSNKSDSRIAVENRNSKQRNSQINKLPFLFKSNNAKESVLSYKKEVATQTAKNELKNTVENQYQLREKRVDPEGLINCNNTNDLSFVEGNDKPVQLFPSISIYSDSSGRDINPATMEQKEKRSANRSNDFFVTALVGSDISTVNFIKNNNLGVGLGISAGYNFSHRWSIRSGITFSKKGYAANGNNFQLDAAKLTLPVYNTLQLQEVKGLTNIIEVPLNVEYWFTTAKKTGFYASAGLSAYFTRWEDIDYSILLDGTKVVEREKSYNANEENTHAISGVFDLSAGWYAITSNRFFVELGPYAKIPITRMGVGDIKLMSFGISAALSFRPLHKK
jgi:hypothetical protein